MHAGGAACLAGLVLTLGSISRTQAEKAAKEALAKASASVQVCCRRVAVLLHGCFGCALAHARVFRSRQVQEAQAELARYKEESAQREREFIAFKKHNAKLLADVRLAAGTGGSGVLRACLARVRAVARAIHR